MFQSNSLIVTETCVMVVVILVDCPLVLQRSLNTITGKEIFVSEQFSFYISVPHFLQNALPIAANFNRLVRFPLLIPIFFHGNRMSGSLSHL